MLRNAAQRRIAGGRAGQFVAIRTRQSLRCFASVPPASICVAAQALENLWLCKDTAPPVKSVGAMNTYKGDGKARDAASDRKDDAAPRIDDPESKPRETGGPKGPEPTRYGDWERNGKCVDF